MAAIVRPLKVVECWSHWHDAGWVNVLLAIIARLDLIAIKGVLDARPLIELAQVVGEIRVVLEVADVALEMAIVDEVEALADFLRDLC